MSDITLDEGGYTHGEEDVAAFAGRIAQKIEVLQSQKADIEEAIENYKGKLRETLGDVKDTIGTKETGFFAFESYISKPFNAAKAEKELPHDRWLAISKPARATNAATAKKILTEAEYALCQKPNEKASITIKRVGDDD